MQLKLITDVVSIVLSSVVLVVFAFKIIFFFTRGRKSENQAV